MNWKLIAQLSVFAAVMGIGTVFFIPSRIEPILWIMIFVACAYLLGKRAPGRLFAHGFCLALVNCVWITGAHVLFAATYLANHAAAYRGVVIPDGDQGAQLALLVRGGCTLAPDAYLFTVIDRAILAEMSKLPKRK